MRIFKIERKQILPITIDQAWAYFSNPHNLSEITPPQLGLRIKSDVQGEIFNGMMIEYTVKPLGPMVMDWVSEIKHIHKPFIFVDEQSVGPYKIWYHQHLFKSQGKNVEVIDRVCYALPLGLFDGILNDLMVKNKLEEIFTYRKKVLQDRFK